MKIENIRIELKIWTQILMSLKFLIVFESLIKIVHWFAIV
jgi:hypothetical protein